MTFPSHSHSARPELHPLLHAYRFTLNPSLMFVSGITAVAGASQVSEIAPTTALVIAGAAFLSYGFGQALTGISNFDNGNEAGEPTEVYQTALLPALIISISLTGICFCIAAFSWYAPIAVLPGFLIILGIGIYLRIKSRWWGGPILNSGFLVLLVWMGYLAGSLGESGELPSTLCWTFSAAFFAFANLVLVRDIRDVRRDEAAGYRTLPMMAGMKGARLISDLFAALAWGSGLAVYEMIPHTQFNPAALMLFFGSGGILLLAQASIHSRHAGERRMRRAAILVTDGYVLLISAIVALMKPEWIVPLAVYLAALVLTDRIYIRKSER